MKRSSTWFALILIASALLLSAASSNPSPKPSSTTETPQANNPRNESHSAAQNPSPLKNQIQSKNAETEGDDQNGQSDEALKLDRLLALYTGQLATYTFLLFVVGALQVV